ncbi:SIR2 family protein [Fluviicola sp.]|uniref:SIR2 family protein n=1 Tax=Fluviicola sp. TaxID=1917219 RepID=UPI0031DDA2CC
MSLNNAIEKILTGNCLLFTGSGFGYGAKNIQDKEFLLGSGLSNLLYQECGITEHDNDLKSASELFLDDRGEHELIEILKREFTLKTITEDHSLIGTLPWKRIYTTNYDQILEHSYIAAGNLLTPVSLIDKIDQYKDFRKLCVHLNGYIDSLTPNSLNHEFKLTNTSYLTTDFINSQWVDLFRSDIQTCDEIIFIGFSTTSDLDISRIIAEKITSIKEKCLFIVGPQESSLNIKRLEKFGEVYKIGLNGFVNEIKEKQKTFTPPEEITYIFKSFKQFSLSDELHSLKDDDFYELMLKGNLNSTLAHQSLIDFNKYPYILKREEVDTFFEKVNGGQLNFVVHSNLGNGKTCYLHCVALTALHQRYNVFKFEQYFDITNAEVERICNLKGKNLIIIDGYSNDLDLIETVERFRKSNTILLIAERSIVNDTIYDALEEKIGNNYTSFNLNHLHNSEVLEFSKLLTSYGLWGKDAGLSLESKRRRINDDFHATIRLTLLDVLKSPDIRSRLTNLIDPLKSNKPFYHASLLILSSNILDFSLTLEELVYLLDEELLNNPSFYNNSQLNELIDFKNRTIKINSSILAESILHSNKYHHDLIPLLVNLVKKLNQTRANKNHHNILKSIISHSRLQKLFNTTEHNDFRKLVIKFFEEIKNLEYCTTNPFFWLQYAMARLEIRDYKVADQFFNSAYAFAQKRANFDTFQLDNHYSRFLLENEIFNGDLESCMPQFLKAHAILNNRNDQNNNRHYPFKVARNYSKFYDSFFKDLPEQDKKIFLISCQEILRRIDEYNSAVEERNRNRVVKDCFEALSSILLKESALLQ